MIHCRIAVINMGIPHLRNDIASVIFFQQGLSLALASQEVPFNPAGIVWDSCPGPRWGVLVKSNLPKNISHRVIENIKVLFGIWQFHISSDINWNQDLISTSVEQHYLLIIWHEGLWWQSLEALYSASSTGLAGSVLCPHPPTPSIFDRVLITFFRMRDGMPLWQAVTSSGTNSYPLFIFVEARKVFLSG